MGTDKSVLYKKFSVILSEAGGRVVGSRNLPQSGNGTKGFPRGRLCDCAAGRKCSLVERQMSSLY